MNISNETQSPRNLWRAEKGGQYAFLTINLFGEFRINTAYDYRHPEDERMYKAGNYFRKSEAFKFCEGLKSLFLNRV